MWVKAYSQHPSQVERPPLLMMQSLLPPAPSTWRDLGNYLGTGKPICYDERRSLRVHGKCSQIENEASINIHVLSVDPTIPHLAICPKKVFCFVLDVYA